MNLSLHVVLVDLPRKIRNINTSIALSRDVKIVLEVLGPSLKEVLKSSQGVLGLRHIILIHVLRSCSPGESYSGGTFNIQNISSLVPWLRVFID